MIALIALAGLLIGSVLNRIIARQAAFGKDTAEQEPSSRLDLIPVAGSLRRRDWVALVVEALCALMAVAIFQRYGLSLRALVLFLATLVLIDTGAVDFRIRMIDTLVILVATLVALALAQVTGVGWFSSAMGLVTAGAMFLLIYIVAKVLFPGHAVPFGLGDVYLAAFIGALVGFLDLPRALFYGMLMAGIVAFVLIVLKVLGRAVPTYIAYGTYLCLGVLFFLATR